MDIPSMSPLGLFLSAGPVSQFVMALLLVASVWTWVLIIDAIIVAARISTSLASARTGGQVGVLWPLTDATREAAHLHLPDETGEERRTRSRNMSIRLCGSS
jgi:biopolymer transport protein ExbB/TolQ